MMYSECQVCGKEKKQKSLSTLCKSCSNHKRAGYTGVIKYSECQLCGKEKKQRNNSPYCSSCAQSGDKNPHFGKKRPELSGLNSIHNRMTLEKRGQRLKKAITSNRGKTRPEKSVEDFLIRNKVQHEYSFMLNGRQFDFRVGKHLIEVQGMYWHSKPEVIERDKTKNKMALEESYNIVYITDTQINKGDFTPLQIFTMKD